MIGINLHQAVRPIINALHPDIKATLYQSTGQTNTPDGSIKSTYAEGVSMTVQKQSEGPNTLAHTDRVGMEDDNRKFYLNSSGGLSTRIAGIVRPLSRGGDMFQLEDGTWWLIDSIIEDFTKSGWASVRATMQVNGPDFKYSDWWTE